MLLNCSNNVSLSVKAVIGLAAAIILFL